MNKPLAVVGIKTRSAAPDPGRCLELLDLPADDPAALPFAPGDCTAGSENELQVAVIGSRQEVDLPLAIAASGYYADVARRAASGDASPQLARHLEDYLADNPEQVWENSWVRFPFARLGCHARNILLQDLQADKKNPAGRPRTDSKRCFLVRDGECWLRLPISYLLKLALAEVVDEARTACPLIRAGGRRLMDHFLNDNTSPETFSFHVVAARPGWSVGRNLARETAKRFLFSHLLLLYANRRFGLLGHGQRALIFFSPHPPVRQRRLNDGISDAFYRELFMSPCLSGWDEGEDKHRYMELCHRTLSRSQLNAVSKLREAGIIANNLVVLPHTSNISLANNGTHVSLGSRWLGGLLAAEAAGKGGFGPAHEKYLGDLTVKVVEHFLPLFVGIYSAAPYRLAFEDFHPERVLGFLPHELDYSHLRMLWRRWRGKARNRLLGRSLTPFGPVRLDHWLGRLLGLKGDLVPDHRLLDYPVALLATDRHSAQDGTLGNEQRLKEDLHALGIIDRRLSLYQFCKLREHAKMGFSGFEARYYSLFAGLERDLGAATDLQALLNCLAFKYMLNGRVNHELIPAQPRVESERRQIIFGAAIGLPTFFVRKESGNRFLLQIIARTEGVRPSRRYPGYLRVGRQEYCLALLALIREDAADLVEMFNLAPLLADLEQRLLDPSHAVAGRLLAGIMKQAGYRADADPGRLPAAQFNLAAERYYRGGLRNDYLREGLNFLTDDLVELAAARTPPAQLARRGLGELCNGWGPVSTLAALRGGVLNDDLAEDDAARLLKLLILTEENNRFEERCTSI